MERKLSGLMSPAAHGRPQVDPNSVRMSLNLASRPFPILSRDVDSVGMSLTLESRSFLFLSRCFPMFTAFLVRG